MPMSLQLAPLTVAQLPNRNSWRLAFGLANKTASYRQVAMPPRDALIYANGSRTPFKHMGMLQHTPDKRPAFLHRTGVLRCARSHNAFKCMQFTCATAACISRSRHCALHHLPPPQQTPPSSSRTVLRPAARQTPARCIF